MVRFQRSISMLSLAASIFALGVIALGAFTRLIDAGLGCPDWPGCYGQLVIPFSDTAKSALTLNFPDTPLISYKAWAEMLHRYCVGGLSLLILIIALLIARCRISHNKTNIFLALFLILLLCYQIILGRWTVTLQLLPAIVTQHLLGGFLILATLWMIYLNNQLPMHFSDTPLKGLKAWIGFGIILLLLQILLGAWTSTNYAALSCADFPFCSTENPLQTLYLKDAFNFISPIGINYEGGVLATPIRQTIQIVHRLGALTLALYFIVFAGVWMPTLKNLRPLFKTFHGVLILLVLQVCIGITNVIFKLPLVTAVLHNLTAALLLLSLLTLLFQTIRVQKEINTC